MKEADDRSPDRSLPILVFIALAGFVFYLFKPADVAFLTDDSAGYIYLNAARPIGYPLFLAGVKALTGSYRWLPQIQLALVFCGFLALALAVRRLLGSAWAGAIVLALSAANVAAVSLAFSLMSDGLSLALLCLFAAATLRFVKDGRSSQSLTKSLIAGAAVMVRPVNAALLVADLVAIAGLGGATAGRKARLGVLAVACVVAGLAASPIAYRLVLGAAEGKSPLARGLFQKAIYVEPISEQPYMDCIGDKAYDAVKLTRNYVRTAPEPIRRYLMQKMSDHLRFDYVIPVIANQKKLEWGSDADPYLRCYAAQAFRERPLQLAGGAFVEFWALVSNEPFLDAASLALLKKYVETNPLPALETQPEPPVDASFSTRIHQDFGYPLSQGATVMDIIPPHVRNPLVALPLRLFGLLAFAAPFAAAALFAFTKAARIRQALLAVVSLGVISLAGKAISAIVEFALLRYAIVYWPIDVAIVVIFGAATLAWTRRAPETPLARIEPRPAPRTPGTRP